MTSGFFSANLFRGLAFRVLLFLSLALLPIGLIAVVQTREVDRQNHERAELSLIAITEQAARQERTLFQSAFGSARALSSVVQLTLDRPIQCSAILRAYQKQSPIFSLVSFVRADGLMNCASSPGEIDFSTSEKFMMMQENPDLALTRSEAPSITDEPVVIVYAPVNSTNALGEVQPEGFVTLSLPDSRLATPDEVVLPFKPLRLITFNTNGEIISAEMGIAKALKEMPADIALRNLASPKGTVFQAANAAGVTRYYAVTQIIPGMAYAMSVWPIDTPIMQTNVSNKLSVLMPVAMWIASLLVGFWALNRLAITHIRKLGRQMRHFALNRTLPRNPLGRSVPIELIDMEAAFIGMAESILRDEAAIEDSLRDKNILLKEVHHRVKNNLQLISSIMNMQIRQSKTSESRDVLKRLQDRILSLATVHKSLYQNNELDRVDGGILLKEIVNQVLAIGLPRKSGIDVSQSYDCVQLEPDDAAPLTLLTSEAVTNALKYVSAPYGEQAKMSVSLSVQGKDRAVLRIANTTTQSDDLDGTGLGSKLISAFARQLNGTVTINRGNGIYEMLVDFPVPESLKQTTDF